MAPQSEGSVRFLVALVSLISHTDLMATHNTISIGETFQPVDACDNARRITVRAFRRTYVVQQGWYTDNRGSTRWSNMVELFDYTDDPNGEFVGYLAGARRMADRAERTPLTAKLERTWRFWYAGRNGDLVTGYRRYAR